MKGFSLIETLVVIFIFTLLMGAVSGLIVSSYNNYNYLWDQIRAVSEARRGMRRMLKEIREAQMGVDGSYPIAKAGDKEFIFYSDVDHDDDVERVRYFLNSSGSGVQSKTCVSYSGDCTVSFDNISSGEMLSAEVVVSIEGDFGWSREEATVYLDGVEVGKLCKYGCSDCPGSWEGTSTLDVRDYIGDGSLEVRIDPNHFVDAFCDWTEPNHSVLAKVDLSWESEVAVGQGELKREIKNSVGNPESYSGEGKTEVVARYVRNSPPIFDYFDSNGVEIEESPARLKDTRTMKILLMVDVDTGREPEPFELSSRVFLRNLDSIYAQ